MVLIMCGIFGVVSNNNAIEKPYHLTQYLNNLYILSESRGKEASGFAIKKDNKISVLKAPVAASDLIKTREYSQLIKKNFLSDSFSNNSTIKNNSLVAIGHSRLVTNGRQDLDINNQPVVKDGAVCIHNGIVVNDGNLWKRHSDIHQASDVDTEIIVSLIQKYRNASHSLSGSVRKTFNELEGAASICIFFNNTPDVILTTNTGSLFICKNKHKNILLFASEKFILKQILQKWVFRNYWKDTEIVQIQPFTGFIINAFTFHIREFPLKGDYQEPVNETDALSPSIRIEEQGINLKKYSAFKINSVPSIDLKNKERIMKKIFSQPRPAHDITRCAKCTLPESFPSIEFDDDGVCNYCRSYNKIHVKGPEALEKLVAPFRSNSDEPDCIVSFSGGRDSSYMLHYLKKVLHLNPIAYTFDWGMVTDLARRNQARLCGKLGIEHILISADIEKKRENIRKNLQAWLKKPDLGMVPILMAGDKQLFNYYPYQLMKQTGIQLYFNGSNRLEKTNFKMGFCGIKEEMSHENGQLYTGISLKNKIDLALYYGKNYLLNPAYINSSLYDTIHAYYSSYFIPDVSTYFFNYIPWNEDEIITTLRKEYDWEIATDTNATWRIGDGTAAFYDYIYYTVAGFSEFDTFRSNQIRESLISREKAMKLIQEENIPRYESLEWYAQTVRFDLDKALDVIHSIPKLWDKSR